MNFINKLKETMKKFIILVIMSFMITSGVSAQSAKQIRTLDSLTGLLEPFLSENARSYKVTNSSHTEEYDGYYLKITDFISTMSKFNIAERIKDYCSDATVLMPFSLENDILCASYDLEDGNMFIINIKSRAENKYESDIRIIMCTPVEE